MNNPEQYKIGLDACPTPIILVSSGGVVVRTNSRLDKLFGYDRGELIGRSVEILVPEDIRPYHPDLRDAYFDVPTTRRMGTGRDLNGVRKDGEMIPVEIGLDPIDFHGDLMVMVSVLDIRERKRGEVMIRRAMDAATSAMIQVDENGRIELVNESTEILFGYTKDELLGMSIEMLVPERYRRKHAVYRSSYQTNRDKRAMGGGRELFGLRKDGTEFPVEIGLTPIEGMSGNSTMATINDVTRQREVERQIKETSERLKLANGELQEFAYSTSHDLKAPLTSIAGLLSYCGDDLENGKIHEVQHNIVRAKALTERLAKRIEDMLALAKAEDFSNKKSNVDVASTVNDVWNALEQNGVKLETSFRHAEPFQTVSTRFVVVLENLLSNTIKYRDPEKINRFVQIETWSESNSFFMTVADNGIGIPPEHRSKLFGLFQRIANSDKPGSGLGLALVKKHIAMLHGEVSFESHDDMTVFKVQLPQAEVHELELASGGVA